MLEKQNKFLKITDLSQPDPNPVEPKKWTRSPALKLAQQKYYEKNKTKLVEDQLKYNYKYVRQSWSCECGDTMKYSAKYLHLRSDRHKRRMTNIQNGVPAGSQPCNTPFICECGSKILHKNRKQHFNSSKHQKYIDSLVEPSNICMTIIEEEEPIPQIRIL